MPPFWVSETRQGYVAVVVVAVFTAVIITYYTIISTNSLYIMELLRSTSAIEDGACWMAAIYVDILDLRTSRDFLTFVDKTDALFFARPPL